MEKDIVVYPRGNNRRTVVKMVYIYWLLAGQPPQQGGASSP
jgi:hypothetical protein